MVSRLYKAIAAAETIHALKHLEIMNGIGSTLDNLKEAARASIMSLPICTRIHR